MHRTIYLPIAAVAFVALCGCSAPAWWLAEESATDARAGSLKDLRSEPNLDAADLETRATSRGNSAKNVNPPPDHNALIEATLAESAASQNSERAAQRDRTAPRAKSPGGRDESRAFGASADRDDGNELAAEVSALGFADPREEASALAALQATPPEHRKYLLRTMQASASMRRQHESQEITPLPSDDRTGNVLLAAGELAGRTNPAVARRQPIPRKDAHRATSRSVQPDDEVQRAVRQASHIEDSVPGSLNHDLHAVQMRSNGDASAASTTWQSQLAGAIAALESQLSREPDGDAQRAVLESKLRLLYLAADRRDEAIGPHATGPAAQQQFWSSEIFGLATLLDADQQADAKQRAAAAAPHLRQAAERLAEFGGLIVKNLHFCSEVKGFGAFVGFPNDEFRQGQEVLLYCEVENFQSELREKGYHTALKARYEVFNTSGERIADKDLGLKDEFCQNRRRDFFVPYFISMPKQAPPGKYQLKLTLEDVHAGQMAEATIEFEIKGK